jgi:hypothetical protein
MALLGELARELGDDAIATMEATERARAICRVLANKRALLIIDMWKRLKVKIARAVPISGTATCFMQSHCDEPTRS